MTSLPREFRIVAECCRWPVPGQESKGDWWDGPIDWPRVARIAKRHRVEALVWNRLRLAGVPVPEEMARALKRAADRTARRNLQAARECLRLKFAFDDAGVSVLFIKGVTLAMLAYGTLALKAGRDIDVLIDPDQLDEAAATLTATGYACIIPDRGTADRLRGWHRLSKESVWRHRVTGALIELHTRLVDNPMLLPGIALQPRRSVLLEGGQSLPTLRGDELFAYLCVHGASSAWFRLKWLADLAALIAPLPPAEVERLYRRALTLGAGRAASVAMLLCASVLAVPMQDSLHRELRRGWVARAIAWAALRKMTGRYVETELDTFRAGTLSIQLIQPFLLPGWRFALSETRRLMVRPEDQLELYGNHPIGPFALPRLLLRKIVRLIARKSGSLATDPNARAKD